MECSRELVGADGVQDIHPREFDATAPLIVGVDGTPEGDATIGAPLDLTTAIRYVLPGQSVDVVFSNGSTRPVNTSPGTLTGEHGSNIPWAEFCTAGPIN